MSEPGEEPSLRGAIGEGAKEIAGEVLSGLMGLMVALVVGVVLAAIALGVLVYVNPTAGIILGLVFFVGWSFKFGIFFL